MPSPEQSEEVFRGSLIRVVLESWPEGRREVVRHPGAAAIVALVDGDVVLVKQLRQAIRAETLEIPAGILDHEGESPGECAERELLEEAGYRAVGTEALGVILSSPGFSDERIELFVCSAEPEGDPEEGIEVVRMPFPDALQAIRDGQITDAKSVAALLLEADRRR